MSLNPDQVARIAQLARIELSPAELNQTGEWLTAVLGLIEQLQAVDTTGIEPMTHAAVNADMTQRLRADAVIETDHRAAYQALAPEVEAGLYLVPKVIE